MTDNVIHLKPTRPKLPPREDRDWVTSHELINDATISYRQLDYWCRTGLLEPLEDATPGSGDYRRFNHTQARRAYLIRVLLDAGMALQFIRASIDQFQEHGTVTAGALTITIHDTGAA